MNFFLNINQFGLFKRNMTTSGSEKLGGNYQLSVKGGDTFSGVTTFLPLSADYESRLKPRSDLNLLYNQSPLSLSHKQKTLQEFQQDFQVHRTDHPLI